MINRIQERLAGELSAESLAAWAADQFYAVEMEQLTLAADESEAVLMVLDELMFADDEEFALDQDALQELIVRLQHV
ncbi:MAG: hypothetical protein MUD01_11655 [Chloroflexaceae bacterium]|nr:hypothetical protein [Chloroflexaceae bacterium]